jgi:N-acetylneuraminate synthase
VTQQILIIAEAGVNHNGSVEMACDLVDAAADAGADIVKFQTWKTDEALTKHAPKPRYQKRATGTLDSQIEMVRRLELNEEEHRKIVEHCALRSVEFLSSPFDLPSFQFLVDDLRVRRLKIASSEIDNAPLLLAAARSGRPVFLSTGMSTLGDVETALAVLAHGLVGGQESLIPAGIWEAYSSEKGRQKLEQQVTLLHCTTEYPAAVETANLRALNTLGDAFALPVGLSDHTPGIAVSIAAAARGAAVLEKHLTLDRTLSGPDHAASIEPDELRNLVEAVRDVERALGDGRKIPVGIEWENRRLFRKRVVARQSIRAGEAFSSANIAIKRSDRGASPMRFWQLLGASAGRDYDPDDGIED